MNRTCIHNDVSIVEYISFLKRIFSQNPDILMCIETITKNNLLMMMKNNLLIILLIASIGCIAQTNTLPDSGNVGIGTTNPNYKLEVIGKIGVSAIGSNNTSYFQATDEGLSIFTNSDNLNLISGNTIINNTTEYSINADYFSYRGDFFNVRATEEIGLSTEYELSLKASQNIKMESAQTSFTGNVGIGTSNPQQLLTLQTESDTVNTVFQINSGGTATSPAHSQISLRERAYGNHKYGQYWL